MIVSGYVRFCFWFLIRFQLLSHMKLFFISPHTHTHIQRTHSPPICALSVHLIRGVNCEHIRHAARQLTSCRTVFSVSK